MSHFEDKHRTLERVFTLDRLVNTKRAAEGPILPPRLSGSVRIPLVSGLQITRTQSFFGGTQFTLVWEEPFKARKEISHFNVYVTGLLTNNTQPLGPYSTRRSPAEVRVQADSVSRVTFIVQTALKNGQLSDMLISPSVSGVTIAPTTESGDYGTGTIPVSALADGTIGQLLTWDPVATTIGPGTTDYILTGQGASSVPAFTRLNTATSKSSNFTVDSTGLVYIYLCDCSGGAITATLPAISGVTHRSFHFKKIDSSGNALTIDGNGSETIDGATTLVVTGQYEAPMLVAGPSEWHII